MQLKLLLEKAGLPDIRFHNLRHSTVTLLLSKGVHPKVVQEILGHSEISMTLDTYSHVLRTIQRDAMDKMKKTVRVKVRQFLALHLTTLSEHISKISHHYPLLCIKSVKEVPSILIFDMNPGN